MKLRKKKNRVEPEFEETPEQIREESKAFVDLLKKTGVDKALKKLSKE